MRLLPLVALMGAAPPATDALQPGFWEARMLMSVAAPGTKPATPQGDGILMAGKCSDTARPIAAAFSEMNEECTIKALTVKDGRISARMICAPDKDGFSMDLTLDGPVSPNRLILNMTGHGGNEDLEMAVAGRVDLVRARACRLEDERF